jgi:hypothetical protein
MSFGAAKRKVTEAWQHTKEAVGDAFDAVKDAVTDAAAKTLSPLRKRARPAYDAETNEAVTLAEYGLDKLQLLLAALLKDQGESPLCPLRHTLCTSHMYCSPCPCCMHNACICTRNRLCLS